MHGAACAVAQRRVTALRSCIHFEIAEAGVEPEPNVEDGICPITLYMNRHRDEGRRRIIERKLRHAGNAAEVDLRR